MFTSARYVLKENCQNIYRIYSIAKYEILAEMRNSKLGLFWNFANPVIQVLTYWFVFGYVFNRQAVEGVPFMLWMLGGMVVWLYVSPCITGGCGAIYRRVDVITKMKFPVSILPMTVVLNKLFEHLCLLLVLVVVFATQGLYPNIYWLGILYYMLCAVLFSFALSLTTSVLNMLARDTGKLIRASMRMLFYLTPVLWEPSLIPSQFIRNIIKCNPIYYIVTGYRNCLFFHDRLGTETIGFAAYWIITIGLFLVGSHMMYKFKTRFIDMI